MAVTTIGAHVSRALDFFDKTNVFIAIGRTTPWPTDAGGLNELDNNFVLPLENRDAKTVEELIGLKGITRKTLVVPDEAGTIVYDGVNWREVPMENAYAENARYVFVEAQLLYDELPLVYYRQVGLFTGVVRATGVSAGKDNLLPAEVANFGVLEVINNRKPASRQLDQKETVSIVIEF